MLDPRIRIFAAREVEAIGRDAAPAKEDTR